MSRSRIGALVLLVVLLLVLGLRGTSDGKVERPPTPPEPTPAPASAAVPSADDPSPSTPGLTVRTCGDGPVGILALEAETGDSTGIHTPVERSCEATGASDVCVFVGLAPGRYRLGQEGFSALAEVAFDGSGSAQFDCERVCQHRFDVTAHGCASAGTIRLSTSQPQPYSSELAQAEWQAGESVTIEGLPCGALAAEITGGTCATDVAQVESSGLFTAHAIHLVPARVLNVHVIDSTSQAPIPGARVITTAWFHATLTDADGDAAVVLGRFSFQAATILATGYAGHELIWDDIPWQGHDEATITVALQATTPLRVVCDDQGTPCATETQVRVYNAESRFRACTKSPEPGVWTCPSVPGDLADGRLGTRRIPPIPVPEDTTELTIRLPPPERSVCFVLPEGETCRAVVSDGSHWSEQLVQAGDSIALSTAPRDPIVGLRCSETSWYDVLAENTAELCITPDLEPLGSICVELGRACELRAKEPRWDNTARPLTPCVDGVPAGIYEVSCYGAFPVEVTAIAGETVTIGAAGDR